MYKIKLFLLLAAFSARVGLCQEGIGGKVVDETGEPLIGATVIIKGTMKGAISDLNGEFMINAAKTDTLVVSFVGYITQEIVVGGKQLIDVELLPAVKRLSEVVVVGFGVQSKKSVVASITQKSGDDLIKTGTNTNVSEALQGLMPGVVTLVESGQPGASGVEILIRGKSTWADNSPLTLVDGIETNINDVDFNEIETISVLKDASATAVYGSKGANGVILVTTKRGLDSKPKVNFSANFGFKFPTTDIDFGDYPTALRLYNEALANDGSWNMLIPESTIEEWEKNYNKAGPYNQYFPEINWFDELVQTGYQQQYNMNIRGGSKYLKYFASLGYLNDGDIFATEKQELYDPSFYYRRYNWRTNFDFNVSKTTVLGVDLYGKMGYKNDAGYRDGNQHRENFWKRLYEAPMNQFPIKYDDGEWGDSDIGIHNMVVFFNETGQRNYKTFEGTGVIKLKQKLDFLVKGLAVRGKVSYKNKNSYRTNIIRANLNNNANLVNIIRYFRVYDYANPEVDENGNVTYPEISSARFPNEETQLEPLIGQYDQLQNHSNRLYYEGGIEYKNSFGPHNISALALVNRNDAKNSSGSNIKISLDESWVGRFTYNYKEKYLLEMNASYMGHENFAPGKRYDFFPSYSLGWRISEEPFIKNTLSGIINNMKIRYSYGEVGNYKINSPTEYAYIQTFSTGGSVIFGDDQEVRVGDLYKEGVAANPEITWETGIKQNAGMELDLFEKIAMDIDFYKEHRVDILMEAFSATHSGYTSPWGNLGETKTQGVELDLEWKDKIGPSVNYWLRATLSINDNRIVYRQDGANELEHLKDAGKPIGWNKAYVTTGFYSSIDDIYNYAPQKVPYDYSSMVPGDLLFVDYNADGEVNNSDMVVTEKLTYPLNTFGLTIGFSYKGFTASARFYAVDKVAKDIDKLLLFNFPGVGNYIKVQPHAINRWTPETAETATVPALHVTNEEHNQNKSSYTFQNAAYIRLKNVELSYDMPAKISKRLGLGSIQIYGNGNNLLTFTKLDERIDPEVKGATVYPLVRRVNVGFRVNF